MNPADVRKIVNQSRAIEGWFSSEAAMLFAWVNDIQRRNNIHGDSFEIGCHHGKSALLMASMLNPEREKLAVCDLFGMQAGNVSRSGHGCLSAFDRNVQQVRETGLNIDVYQKNSAELSASEIGRNYRFFHVDGGHNPDEALHDLKLAAECTIDSGVLVLDDPFRTEWPGVTEALIRFVDEQPDFHPIMVGCNKLLLTRSSCSQIYINELESMSQRERFGFGYPWRVKQMPFVNTQLRVLYVPENLQKKSIGNLMRMLYNKSGRPGAGMRKADPRGVSQAEASSTSG